MPKAKPWDSESARLAAEKSAEVRQRKAALTPEERALEAISAKTDVLARELLKAALGQDEFKDLKLDLRLVAIKTSLEYALGKPTTRKVGDEPGPEAPTPENLFG
jgi:hypothetical protein